MHLYKLGSNWPNPTGKHLRVIADARMSTRQNSTLLANKTNRIVGSLRRNIASRLKEVLITFSLAPVRLPLRQNVYFGHTREMGEVYKCGGVLQMHDLQK